MRDDAHRRGERGRDRAERDEIRGSSRGRRGEDGADVTTPRPGVCVLAATPLLTVTVEAGLGGDEVHVHPGGQGLWVARMARCLDADVVVCGPFGGETGTVVAHLAEAEGLTLRSTTYLGSNGAYVHDRRDGERRELATMNPQELNRHETDDLFGTVLVEALDADVCLLTGADPASTLEPGFFGRLVGDLGSAGVTVVADLSGDAAAEAADAGIDVLKMSHEEILAADLAPDASVPALALAGEHMLERGVRAMVISRADEPCLLVTGSGRMLVTPPSVTTVDHRGAGDSMTAGVAVGLARGMDLRDAVRLGVAAGALNVTRRGLGTGQRDQVERLAARVTVDPVTAAVRSA